MSEDFVIKDGPTGWNIRTYLYATMEKMKIGTHFDVKFVDNGKLSSIRTHVSLYNSDNKDRHYQVRLARPVAPNTVGVATIIRSK